MTMKVSQTRWHKKWVSDLCFHIICQPGSIIPKPLSRKSFIWSELLLCDLFPPGRWCVKHVLSGRWTRGRCTGFDVEGLAGVTQNGIYSPQRDPMRSDVLQKDNAQIILTCIKLFLNVVLWPCYNLHTSKYIWAMLTTSELQCFWICKNMKLCFWSFVVLRKSESKLASCLKGKHGSK